MPTSVRDTVFRFVAAVGVTALLCFLGCRSGTHELPGSGGAIHTTGPGPGGMIGTGGMSGTGAHEMGGHSNGYGGMGTGAVGAGGTGGVAGNCNPTTCPLGCCDPMTGTCIEDGCEFYGVPCGGNMTASGPTCYQCQDGQCQTCGLAECVACVPDCAGKKCGDPDGCGLRCTGPCPGGNFCSIALGACAQSCDQTSCPNGCCDASGVCQPGLTDAACGAAAEFCAPCPSGGPACIAIQGEPVAGGACQTCDVTTCPQGCCSTAGHCITTEKDAACGTAGVACADCTLQGSVCQSQDHICNDCTPNCAGKACGDADGCGGPCPGSCPTGHFCSVSAPTGDPPPPPGCYTCDPTNCQGCCTSTGECVNGSNQHACGGSQFGTGMGGQACADCGSQACAADLFGTQSCKPCGSTCGLPGQPSCASDGCGGVCPNATCPSQGGITFDCVVGPKGVPTCQPHGFCGVGSWALPRKLCRVISRT